MASSNQFVADRVARAIQVSGSSIRKVCESTGISKATLRRRLSGSREFKVGEIVAIADHLGIPAGSLLPEQRPPERP